MKKLSVLLLSALLIVISFAFTSCDQQAVDDALNNLMETSVDIFEAVFKKTDDNLEEDGENENEEGTTQNSTSQESQDQNDGTLEDNEQEQQ